MNKRTVLIIGIILAVAIVGIIGLTVSTEIHEEELKRIAFDELGIGFDSHSYGWECLGRTIRVIGPTENWRFHALYARKEFLENHNVVFDYKGENPLETYNPPTHESIGGYQGDNYGCVPEDSLKDHVGIRGFEQGQLKIYIDGKFTVIVN